VDIPLEKSGEREVLGVEETEDGPPEALPEGIWLLRDFSKWQQSVCYGHAAS
jgi:hypothetical protein